MELQFVFLGIETGDGLYPRLKVRVCPVEASAPTNVAFPHVDITLPMSQEDHDATYQALAARALLAARGIVNTDSIVGWTTEAAAHTPPTTESEWDKRLREIGLQEP